MHDNLFFEPASERIRALNDAFRQSFIGGVVLIRAGVEALPAEQRRLLLQPVRAFDAFTDGDDPRGEHDFGEVEHAGLRFYFKIDANDRTMQAHSPDGADPEITMRVLTVMCADEL